MPNPPSLLESRPRRVPDVDPLEALREAAGRPRMYFGTRAGWRLGLGCAAVFDAEGPHRLAAVREAAARLGQDSHATLFGGFAFAPDPSRQPPWGAFPGARFVLPERVLKSSGQSVRETRFGRRGAPLPPAPAESGAVHDPGDWADAVQRATGAIRDGDVSKVVLARHAREAPADAVDVLEALRRQEPDAHHFLFEPVPGHAWVGASPERLATLEDGVLSTHALAGSARRAGETEDQALGRALQQSEKDILEHELVATFIRNRLGARGIDAQPTNRRRLLRLRTVQHLETPLEGRTPPGFHILDAAEALHPTPAVAGSPVAPSLGWIQRLEPFSRGWYAGGVGWFDPAGDGHLAVALRCALLTPTDAHLFAGAGIVAGSQAEAEWQETEWKLEPMRRALTAARGGLDA